VIRVNVKHLGGIVLPPGMSLSTLSFGTHDIEQSQLSELRSHKAVAQFFDAGLITIELGEQEQDAPEAEQQEPEEKPAKKASKGK
jgi:hypothetical protein